MFVVEYKLLNNMVAKFEFPTSREREIFMTGVQAATSWPRRSHVGVSTSETEDKPFVPSAPPVVKEVKPAQLTEGSVNKGGQNPPNESGARPEPPKGSKG